MCTTMCATRTWYYSMRSERDNILSLRYITRASDSRACNEFQAPKLLADTAACDFDDFNARDEFKNNDSPVHLQVQFNRTHCACTHKIFTLRCAARVVTRGVIPRDNRFDVAKSVQHFRAHGRICAANFKHDFTGLFVYYNPHDGHVSVIIVYVYIIMYC
uniref:Uncharacterized protein n=1 Tax=Sipha flava TaxID=143950 RepID=A0A2S2PVH5_9HEMI